MYSVAVATLILPMESHMMMKAVYIQEYGGPEQLIQKEIPIPVPKNGEILIRVKAFGINRAEIYMRKGVWGEVARVSGIECVGVVEFDPNGRLQKGSKVIALMGGMGRTRNGSYAEFTCVPEENVVSLATEMDWASMAAIPESYATAYSCLYENLNLQKNQTLLIRGGTSSLGQASINIAKNLGVRVLATTRNQERVNFLKELGADTVLVENPILNEAVREIYPEGVDAVLDLVGNSTFIDSMKMVRRGGNVCIGGFLGGSDPISFNVLSSLAPGVNLSFFASFMFGTKEYSLNKIPFEQIFKLAEDGYYQAKPVKTFSFDELPLAHKFLESNEANGKIVVVL